MTIWIDFKFTLFISPTTLLFVVSLTSGFLKQSAKCPKATHTIVILSRDPANT